MYFEARAIDAELRDYPGGPTALARSIMPTIEGMRILRWPADRLDTLGGYLWYHNVTLFTFFLAVFAAVQGAKAFRHMEEERTIEYLLSTGASRARLVVLRSTAYLLSQLVISFGLGAATALALAACGAADTSGAMLTMLAAGICIFPFFALGLILSQLVSSSRVAAGCASIIVTVVYIATNVSDTYRFLAWVDLISPFAHAAQSRPMVPGFSVDYRSWLAMLALGVLVIGAGVVLLEKRDIRSVVHLLGNRQEVHGLKKRTQRVPRTLVGDLLWRQRFGLAAWIFTSSAFVGVFIAMLRGIVDIWENFDFLQQFASSGFGKTAEQQYLALVYEILPPFLAAFVIAQSAKWTSDLRQGRLQYFMATPVTSTGLLARRVTATMAGAGAMIVASLGVATLGALVQGVDFYGLALLRVLAMSMLFSVAFTSGCVLLVALLHGRSATQALSIYVGAAWLVVFMAPYLDWPSWVLRLSVFDAFGHPFVSWPDPSNLVVIGTTTVLGIGASAWVARQRPTAV